jgi:predicted O-linked N-acetylglucosamine transferase (SPINDLY family)
MSENLFLTAIQKITKGELALNEIIAAAQQLTASGQTDYARQLYQVWISFNGENPLRFVAHFNHSTLLTQLGDEAGAEAALRAALAQNPDFAPAHVNLGSSLERQGKVKDAVEQWKTGLDRLGAVTGDAIDYKITLLKQVSRVFSDHHQHESAETALSQCLDVSPELRDVAEQYGAVRLAQCKWPILTEAPRRSKASLLGRFHPLSTCAYADDPLLQLAAASRYVDQVAPFDKVSFASDRRHAPIAAGRRLRIGYVSSDLRAHAVGYLMAQLFETHDREAVEVFVYYCGIPADEDALQQRIKGSAEHWANIRALNDDDAAQRIAQDEIDILVDVNGHTRDARLGLFARRPAPIIVNWLGYPGTMGSAFHHYIIGDESVIPPEDEVYFSERVLRLPCYQPNDRTRIVAAANPTRAEAGLPEDAFVFCCFNAAHKITRFTFSRWMQILAQTPNSVLWLLDYGAETCERLRGYAAEHGVDPARLIYATKLANAHHLARYPLADLFLDTTPYGAHTTASDALWMGVPVLTMTGRSFAARVCGSLVRAAGLGELVCATPADFITRAIALAGAERGRLRMLREQLRANRDTCALSDIDLLTRRLESLYTEMAAEYRAGNLPQPNLQNLEAYFEIGIGFDHDADEIGLRPDYEQIYLHGLAQRHRHRPLRADARLWSETAISSLDAVAPISASKAA